jgi:hypothetical protein
LSIFERRKMRRVQGGLVVWMGWVGNPIALDHGGSGFNEALEYD